MRLLKFLGIGIGVLVMLVVGLVVGVLVLRPAKAAYPNDQLTMQAPLHIPPQLEARIENGEKVFDLTAQQGRSALVDGKQTDTLGFNGSYLGPTLRAARGDHVRVNVTNRLNETTTVHWHGMHLPAAMDGGPHQAIQPGETWQPHWTVQNEASTLWYHPHLAGTTGQQVYRGMAGLFIIDDENSLALDLPHDYGVDDFPVVVQDRKLSAEGMLVYDGHRTEGVPQPAGMIGDTILVNGTYAPYLDAPAGLVRLRLVNASNGRRYNFGFSDNRAFHQIATDGGLLEAPVERTRLLLGVGERAEILVDLAGTGEPVTLMSYPITAAEFPVLPFIRGFFGPDDQDQQFKLLELRPQAGNYTARSIPSKLNTIERLSAGDAVTTRTFSLDSRTINNRGMDHARVDEIVKNGDTEIWEVSNQSPFYHPFHIHAVQFQVLTREGAAAPDYEQGWKDTVVVNPGESVRLIMRFTGTSDPTLPYMFHCHILEHEDMGMMGQFVIVDNLSDAIDIRSPLTEHPEEHDLQH